MKKVELTVLGYRCARCFGEWVPKTDREPRTCPKCKSALWDVPKPAKQRAQA